MSELLTMKLLVDLVTWEVYDENGVALSQQNTPSLTFGDKTKWEIHYVRKNSSTLELDPATDLSGTVTNAYAAADDDFTLFQETALVDDLSAGTISSLSLSGVTTSSIGLTGKLQLIKDGAISEVLTYSGYTINSDIVTFTVSATLVNSYESGAVVLVTEPLLLKITSDNVDLTDIANGVITYTIDTNTLEFYKAVNGSSQISNKVYFQQYLINSDGRRVFQPRFAIDCFGSLDWDGTSPSPIIPGSEFLTKADALSEYLSKDPDNYSSTYFGTNGSFFFLDDDGTVKIIPASGMPGATSGEANTASNHTAGTGSVYLPFDTKTGIDLVFKALKFQGSAVTDFVEEDGVVTITLNGGTSTGGTAGVDGVSSYVYIGYAADSSGTSFQMTPSETLPYIAFLKTTEEKSVFLQSDFTGLWLKWKGTDGEDGVDGQGVPTGGTTGQVLAKKSGTNYDTEWTDPSDSGGNMNTSVYDPTASGKVLTAQVADSANSVSMTNVTGLAAAMLAKADLASPTFTGTPAAPTAPAGTNTTQIATTAFVHTEVANLVGSSASTLDTLQELGAALGDDPNFATTITNLIGQKVSQTVFDNHTETVVTISNTGHMTAAMLIKLNGIADNATNTPLAATGVVALSGSTQSAGTSTEAAPVDHQHGLPANATTSNAGLMSPDDKTAVNDITNKESKNKTPLTVASSGALTVNRINNLTDTSAGTYTFPTDAVSGDCVAIRSLAAHTFSTTGSSNTFGTKTGATTTTTYTLSATDDLNTIWLFRLIGNVWCLSFY